MLDKNHEVRWKERKVIGERNPFNLESITVHLVMLFDVFWYTRLNSQSESGKWWSLLQGRGELDGGGGNSTLGGNPQAVSN